MPFWTKSSYKDVVKHFESFVTSIVPRTGPRNEYERKKIDVLLKIARNYEDARHIPLTQGTWRQIENSRSWYTDTFVSFSREFAKIKSTPEAKTIDKDFESLSNLVIPAPIIIRIRTKEGLAMLGKPSPVYRVITGNIRLMLYRLTGIKPRVVIVEI